MLQTRAIPCLLLDKTGLYKTVKFKQPVYVGDPVNAIKIFNEKEVDELIIVDITASPEGRKPNFELISDIASECFMPLAYGGGISTLDEVKRILEIGVEKVSLNTAAIDSPSLVSEVAGTFGNQSVIVSMDVKKNFWGKYEVYRNRGSKSTGKNPIAFAKEMENAGAGELLVTAIDREGTWEGYDYELIKSITDAVNIPVIANGGAGNISHLGKVVKESHASAVAIGSMAVFQKKGMGVLISFPKPDELQNAFS